MCFDNNVRACIPILYLVRDRGAVVPPEQVTYMHYMSNQQRKLQYILEDTARLKKDELSKFVHEADRLCNIDLVCSREGSLVTNGI